MRRGDDARAAALAGMCLPSTKTMHQHIALVTQSSFCAARHPSSSVLTCGQPTVVTETRLITASMARCGSVYTNYQSTIRMSCGSSLFGWAEFQYSMVDQAINSWHKGLGECIHADGGHLEQLL